MCHHTSHIIVCSWPFVSLDYYYYYYYSFYTPLLLVPLLHPLQSSKYTAIRVLNARLHLQVVLTLVLPLYYWMDKLPAASAVKG